MAKFNFLIPVVCTDSVRVTKEIPDELLPKFRKFLTENPQVSWSSLEQFLVDNDIEKDSEGVELVDQISESCSEFDKDSLYWETSDYGAVDFENDDYTTFDNDRDWLLKALSEVRELGVCNILSKNEVSEHINNIGYEYESGLIDLMSRNEYIQLVTKELPAWLEIEV